jgi:hypothetical protein
MAKKAPVSGSALPLPETRIAAPSLLSTTVVLEGCGKVSFGRARLSQAAEKVRLCIRARL